MIPTNPHPEAFDPSTVSAVDALAPGQPTFRIGHGWDRHRLTESDPPPSEQSQPIRPLKLGGIDITAPDGSNPPKGVIAHSDGDALLHAITDALLAAVNAPDLGSLFPDTAADHDGQDSAQFLAAAAAILKHRGWSIANIDATVLLERPRIAPLRDQMRKRIADILAVDPSLISLKGKSGERVDAVGESRAVEATAIALIIREPTR
ncbi:MAG: 2-C-methyl-D-erythritol 2,4-cyclodiphosphate synthase [Phycisphaerales bacterium]